MRYFKIYLKNNLKSNIELVVLSILLGVVAINLPKVAKVLFNVGILENNKEAFSNNIIKFLGLLVIIFIITFLSGLVGQKSHWTGMTNVKVTLFNKALSNDFNYFIENKPPEIWSDINFIAFRVTKFCKALVIFICKIIEAILVTYAVFKINHLACLILIILVPLVSLSNLWINKKVSKTQNNLIQGGRASGNIGTEVITSVNNIKAKGKYDFFLKKIYDSSKYIHDNLTNNTLLICYWQYVTELIINIAPMIIIYIMIFVSNSIDIEIGEIIALYTVMPMMLMAYRNLFAITIEFSTAKPSLEKMAHILDYKDDCLGNENLDEFKSLEFIDVKVNYDNGKTVTIPHINIKKGDKVLVAGDSGIGKSTMFDIILGLKKNYEGTVKVNGIDIKTIDIVSLRKTFGISFQENGVFNMTLEDNIELGRVSHISFDKVIKTMSLEKLALDKNNLDLSNETVSGGEKSRIAIAQNLISNPYVILIDESLSSVDEEIEKDIMNNLLQDYGDKTFICISHRKSSQQYFDKVLKFA